MQEAAYNSMLLDPQYTSTWEVRGAIQQSRGMHEEAVDSFAHALRLSGESPEANAEAPDTMYNQANSLLELRELPRAVAVFRKLLRLRPGDADAWFNLANAYSAMGSPTEALAALEEAAKLRPDDADGHANRGAIMLDLARPEAAAAAYARAIELKPEDSDLHWNLGIVFSEAYRPRRLAQARKAFKRAVALSPGHLRAWHSGCRTTFELDDHRAAVRWCGRAWALIQQRNATSGGGGGSRRSSSSDGSNRENLDKFGLLKPGEAAVGTGMGGGSENGSDKEEVDPQMAVFVLQIRAASLQSLEQYDLAAEAYRDSLAIDGVDRIVEGDIQAWSGLGTVLAAVGRRREALASYERALELDQTHPGLLVNMANLRLEIVNDRAVGKSTVAMDESVAGEDTGEGVGAGEAARATRATERDDAIALFDRAAAAAPDNADVAFNRGNALLDAGRLDEAVEGFKRAIALDGNDVGSRANAGLALERLGRRGEAVDMYQTAVTVNPTFAAGWVMLGNAQMAAQQTHRSPGEGGKGGTRGGHSSDLSFSSLGLEEAASSYRQAVKHDPQNADGHANLGIVFSTLGRSAEASAQYEAALALRPSHGPTWANHAAELTNLLYNNPSAWVGAEAGVEAGVVGGGSDGDRGSVRGSDSGSDSGSGSDRCVDGGQTGGASGGVCGGHVHALATKALASYDRATQIMDSHVDSEPHNANNAHPGAAGLWARRGRVLVVLERMDEARGSFQRALRVDPDYAQARLDLEALVASSSYSSSSSMHGSHTAPHTNAPSPANDQPLPSLASQLPHLAPSPAPPAPP